MTLLERLLFPPVRLGEHRLRAAVAGKTVLGRAVARVRLPV